MIGAHVSEPKRRQFQGSTPRKPRTYDEGIVLTRGQQTRVAKCLAEIGRLGFLQGDGFTVQMSKAGPYRELLAIFAHARA